MGELMGPYTDSEWSVMKTLSKNIKFYTYSADDQRKCLTMDKNLFKVFRDKQVA